MRGPHWSDGGARWGAAARHGTQLAERAGVLVHLAIVIMLGAASLLEARATPAAPPAVVHLAASDSTARRVLATFDEATLVEIAKVRARVRRHGWSLLRLRPGRRPWLTVADKRLTGWIVIDFATVSTLTS